MWWRQTKPFECCGERQQAEQWDEAGRVLCRDCGKQAVTNEHAGFQVSKLYAPKQSMRDLAKKWLRACRQGVEAKKTFWNTQLARTWKEAEDAPEWDDVYNRRDDYLAGTVPAGALFLEAGIDVQKDRIEVGVWGFGRARQRWLIEHRVLPGATSQPAVWATLEAMFEETLPHVDGGEVTVDQWGIDSSGFTADVYAFVRSQAGRGNVHAVDGQDSYDGAYLGVGAKDADSAGKRLRRGLKTLKVGVSFCKKELMEQLALRRPEGDAPFPAGFVHLPGDVPQEVVRQLTSEELTTTKGNRVRRSWQTISRAAERGARLRQLRPRPCGHAGLGPDAGEGVRDVRGEPANPDRRSSPGAGIRCAIAAAVSRNSIFVRWKGAPMSGSLFAAMTLAELQAAQRALVQTRLSGTLSTRFADGSMVTYRTDAEIAAQLQFLDRLIAAASPTVTDPMSQPVRAFRLRPWNGFR